jgi:hypothetical protein
MVSENIDIIVSKLKEFSKQGLTFYQAKEKLLTEGYQKSDIDVATDGYQYGSDDTPSPPNPVTLAFEKDPEGAKKVAESIIKDDKKRLRTEALAEGLAGELGPDIQSRLTYESNFLYDIGMSWWLWLLIELVLGCLVLFLRLPLYSYGIIMIVFVVYMAIKRA